MERTVVDNPEAGRFEIAVDGDPVGFLFYERDADTIVFTDIDTDLRLAGQGLGLTLVRHALNAVGAEGLSVLPVDPFVRDFIERHPVYLDLVPYAERTRFDLPQT